MKRIEALLGAWTLWTMVFLYVPIAILIGFSFNTSRLNIVWEGFTLDWYAAVWRDAVLVRSLENSLIVAVVTTILAVVARHRRRLAALPLPLSRRCGCGRRSIFIPMIMPEVIMGVSLLILFVVIHLELGFVTIIISHVTFCFPFVMVAVQARLAGLDPSLEEAALDLGATPAVAFRKVLVPYLMPAIISGALMSFTLSLDELIVTYFTASAGTRTLPLEIFGRVKKGLDPTLNAISTVFILLDGCSRSGHRDPEAPNAPLDGGTEGVAMKFTRAFAAAVLVVASCVGCQQAKKPAEINLFAWSEYVPQGVIDGFTKETGIKVNYETYASNEEMLAKLVSGAQKYDLIQPSEYTIEALIKENRLMPIDWSKVPNFKNIGPQFKNLAARPGAEVLGAVDGRDGRHRREHREGERRRSRATSDVFQEKYKGRIVVLDDPREIVSWALATIGKGPNDVTPETLAPSQADPRALAAAGEGLRLRQPEDRAAQRRRRPRRRVVGRGGAALQRGSEVQVRAALPRARISSSTAWRSPPTRRTPTARWRS